MKKVMFNIIVAVLATIGCTMSAAAQNVYASNSSSNTTLSTSDLKWSYELIKTRMELAGYSLASDDFFTIKKGDIKFKPRTLYSGNEYIIIAIPAESGLKDVDIYLKDSYDNTITRDSDNDAAAMITYSPSYNRDTRIEVKNHDSRASAYSYDCRLLVFYK
jgi:hypothetical protein